VTHDEAKIEFKRLWNSWPAKYRSDGTEALREIIAPHRSLRTVPEPDLASLANRFRVRTETAIAKYTQPDPNGAASLMLS
jgi:hypothetical protein